MSADIPLVAVFDVLSASASDESAFSQGVPSVRRRLSLVLRAHPDTEIQLANGESLSSVETHLTLASGFMSASEVDPQMASEDFGFLVQTSQASGAPFVHGMVIWPNASGPLPYHLLGGGITARVQLTISSLGQLLDYEDPHLWELGRAHCLHISSYSVSCSTGGER